MQGKPAISFQTEPYRRRIRHGGIAAAVPHCGNTDAPAKGSIPRGVERLGFALRPSPVWAKRFQTSANSDPRCKDLARDRWLIGPQCVENAEFQAVEPEPLGQFVV